MRHSKLLIAAIVALLPGAGATFASERLNHNEVYQLRESGQIISMEEVLRYAHTLQPGQLIEAELERERGGYVYELKIIDGDGRIHKLELDAQNGELLKRKSRGRE
jgi:uncharacterized membrane protein YkoI